MADFDFNWKYGDFELRIAKECNKSGFMPELVKWNKDHEYCWTLCYWTKDSEGYELQFVGDRPFSDIKKYDLEIVWSALKSMDTALKGYFEWENSYENS